MTNTPEGISQGWRKQLIDFIDAKRTEYFFASLIIFNAILLGLETSPAIMERWGTIIRTADTICVGLFVVELLTKITAHRLSFFKNGWNVFDFIVIAIAITPGYGALSVLRGLRILRLLTVVPSLRRVVAAVLHSIPGLFGVMAMMLIFFYTSGVIATRFFAESHPEWFGSLGKSFYTLFQVMTLESWSMGIVRPVMEVHPWAWVFFVTFIIIATFTILNLFLGIIVSTIQELSEEPDENAPAPDLSEVIARMEADLKTLKKIAEQK